jgi:hypothetical protein
MVGESQPEAPCNLPFFALLRLSSHPDLALGGTKKRPKAVRTWGAASVAIAAFRQSRQPTRDPRFPPHRQTSRLGRHGRHGGGAMPISVNPGPRAPSELRAAHSQGALPSFGIRGMDLCILDFSWTLGRETRLRFLAYLSARAPLKPLFPAQINNSIQPDYCLTSRDRPARRSNFELGVTNSRLSESCILWYSFSRTDLW